MLRSKLSLVLSSLAFTSLALGATVARAQDAGISPATRQYLVARKLNPPPIGLTLNAVSQNPRAYRGKTMEIEGRLVGSCSAEDGLTRLMLQTDQYGTLSLTVSRMPDWLHSGENLRVLVIVTASGDANVVEMGVPEMEVVALTSSWDIRSLENRERMSKEARVAYDNAVKAAKNRTASGRSSTSLASRAGVRSPLTPSYSGTGGGLSSNAQGVFYAYRDFIKGRNRHLTDQQATDITWAILRYSEALDTDPRLVIALVIAESDFDVNSTSHTGAMGLGQLMPETVREIASKTGLSNPYDPVQNIAGSIWLLRSHLDKYSGGKAMNSLNWNQISLALAAYNAGPGAVKKYGGIPPYRETQNYVRKITAIYKQLCGEAG